MTGPESADFDLRRPRSNPYDPDSTVVLPTHTPGDEPTAVLPTIAESTVTQPGGPLPVGAAEPTVPLAPPGPPEPPKPPTGASASGDGAQSVARSSGVMALFSLVSRATGFLRTAAIGAAIGGGLVGNAYQVSNTLPNMLYEFLLGGILTSVVVPLLVTARKRDADGGEAFTHRLLTAAALLLAAATVVALAAAPLLTAFFANSNSTSASRQLTTTLAYLLLPEIFFYGLSALLGAVLNTRNQFAAPAWAPILNNVTVIVTAAVFLLLPGPATLSPQSITGAQVAVLGIGTTLGIVLQSLALWPALRKVGFRWKWRFDLRGAGLGEAGRLGAWMFVYVGVSQLGLLPVIKIANYAGDRGGPGPLIHNNAFLMFMMVHGIVAVSILTALLPRMSAAAADRNFPEVTRNLSLGTRLSSVVLVPATAAYLVLGIPLTVTVFQWGEFTHDQAIATGYATMAAAIGLVPFAVSQMQIFAFYALRDTKTPALINLPVVVAKITFDLGVFFVVPDDYVVVGLQCGNTVSYIVAVLVSGHFLKRRLGGLDTAASVRTITRLGLAAAVAGLIGWGVAYGIQAALGIEKLGAFVSLVVGGVVLVGVYAVAALRLRVPEVVDVANTVKRRLPGR
ncbi:murein biosynthesis integral membrane protein MurJ [Cryptosporangium arvum]|uniref:murein biosynthesis integral membrane protein MurJ n=1 Tax=Cryptosporangium arvum TaxID=80871 RepID=UPI0004B55B09|nr:murein biosynthesis integral membrane protein MurJ [Cryptosporangium arvum]